MFDYFKSDTFLDAIEIVKSSFPLAIVETIYVTLISTLFAIIIGLPLGIILVAGEDGKILKIPKGVLHVINVIINLLRSVPFLILMILVFPLTRLIVGTAVGTGVGVTSTSLVDDDLPHPAAVSAAAAASAIMIFLYFIIITS